MNILIEHLVHVPYTGKITGGTERFIQLAADALRSVGHRVSIMGPADSTAECVKSPVLSELVAKPIQFKGWYRSIADRAQCYDAILLNQPLTSQWLIDPKLDYMLARSTYINHMGSRWYTEGRAGLRMAACLRYLRSRGGRARYLCKKNADKMTVVAEGTDTRAVIEMECRGAFKRVGNSDFLGASLFDGHFDQTVYPPDAVPARAAEGYVVSIGRFDDDKHLFRACCAAQRTGKPHLLFTPTPVSYEDTQDVARFKSRGTEVFHDVPHAEIMAVLAGADALILNSKNETHCLVAMEAVAHGVPVIADEIPPSLVPFAELVLPKPRRGERYDFKGTNLDDRRAIQEFMQETYSMEALGHRLSTILQR